MHVEYIKNAQLNLRRIHLAYSVVAFVVVIIETILVSVFNLYVLIFFFIIVFGKVIIVIVLLLILVFFI